MKKIFSLLFIIIIVSCGRQGTSTRERIITVSIAPFKYFVEAISGGDFKVNVIVPAGSDPHIYEPFPEQINKLRKSEGYISNGYLGFEMIWLDRFYEANKSMKRLSLGEKITPLSSGHIHEGEHVEGADPHYWVSLKCAMTMASSVRDFLTGLNPSQNLKYEANYQALLTKIKDLDNNARNLFSTVRQRSFMIYHPNLAYLARDYGLEEIPVEFEGKEPPPSRIKELIDRARLTGVNTIFVQREFDAKNARAIAKEIGAGLIIIDPLSEDWLKSTSEIITAVYNSLAQTPK
jgi:zinc transport system substrate-binding protein